MSTGVGYITVIGFNDCINARVDVVYCVVHGEATWFYQLVF